MFGKGKRIKELEARVVELINENEELEEEISSNKLEFKKYMMMVQTLREEKRALLERLKTFEPVLNEPKLKPAITPFCELCDYRVMSGSNVVGCCKDSVCDDFTRRGTK